MNSNRISVALLALAALGLATAGWTIEPGSAPSPQGKTEQAEPKKPAESTPSQVPETQQTPPAQPETQPGPAPEEKEGQAQEQAQAKKRSEAEAAAEAQEASENAKAPKRFIPSVKSQADNSATFPVDI